ncbi:glycoside hydrolase family 15 protein [Flavobacteriaceae bacterium]|nr:glycoside hydrolase family 15 protein [Flavobacteriaceae bacterium]MDA9015487.1 glycoside hydrolase family 15 protein [Flavobacteriaceae bacterium]MDB3862471.1 glycoside hydrolase family 15 protein [Flavobacteriaceae bacterium]MDC3354183.1 glycoside hydrolase family 15 protein [Flavobacteriaceae bacterium]
MGAAKNLNFGIIGNCRSAALINENGSIDWCCLPEFDSPSVFAKILDDTKGGGFWINTRNEFQTKQNYLGDSCILITTFENQKEAFEVIDFMPRFQTEKGQYYAPPELIRFVKPIKGNPEIQIQYDPRLEYAQGKTQHHAKNNAIVSEVNTPIHDSLFLYTNTHKQSVLENEFITLKDPLFFNISYNEKLTIPTFSKCFLDFERTKVYWLNWCSKTPAFEQYNELVQRSAMTLKLMSYDKTGAVLAAVTTSLPETIGEVRNWDYRFCWIRDASMVIRVISKLGHKRIVKNFIDYIVDLIPDKAQKLQIMYGINGETVLTEKILDHFSGYENSKPVRIGNAAYSQKQNDIYGILMDAIHAEMKQFPSDFDRSEEIWSIVKGIVWVVKNNWQKADKGIWEFRSEDQHFTFSKVLCWVAIDRAIKIAKLVGKNETALKWTPIKESIKDDIENHAWNEEVQAYTQSYGSKYLDASVLLIEQYGFVSANEERFKKTVKAIENELAFNGLLYRYKNQDDFGLPSSSFTVCTFWFINSLIKIGEVEKAKKYFEDLLGYSNHLGLFSEDIDFDSKRLLGNFPQAYSHLALIDTILSFNSVHKA